MNQLTEQTAQAISIDLIKPRVDALSDQEIELRRREIIEGAKGDYENLSDELLHELSYIAQSLRKRSSGPPKEAKVAGAAKTKKMGVSDLF